ncbi:hypothetical protein ElyMa_001409300 [Elysia marginata]|uniref:Uncharacterized protein n=1 Tax=Elysia marginata TaxID=1093978 RepID=A0AAV4ITQ4_9GAST|nr:hypothetical protein ElyMa_001409300 [Elysia marginata]
MGSRQEHPQTTLHRLCTFSDGIQLSPPIYQQQDKQRPTRRVQSQAVHFISGGMPSTPTAACEIHTHIEPLGLRRDAAVMNMVERYKRSDESHPNRQLIDTLKPTSRLKKKLLPTSKRNITCQTIEKTSNTFVWKSTHIIENA